MKRLGMVAGLIAVAVLSVHVGAQARPNFSGRWVQVTPADGAGQEQVVKHEGDKLSAVHGSSGDDHVLEYTLNGTETTQTLQSHGQDIVSKVRAAWEKERLVITSITDYGEGRVRTMKQVWSLDATGRLVIVVTPAGAKDTESVTVVYRKQTF
jgi:hypothetical protein